MSGTRTVGIRVYGGRIAVEFEQKTTGLPETAH